MRKLGIFAVILLVPATIIIAVGCSDHRKVIGPREEGGGAESAGGGQVLDELVTTVWGTLEGQITYDGNALPNNPPVNITKDQGWCACDEAKQRGETEEQVWIGEKTPNGIGVANVVVFLRPPEGKFFKIEDTKYADVAQDKELGKKVLDQPFCAYEPRVVVLFPDYTVKIKEKGKDANDKHGSGQIFEVKNSAQVPHNTKLKGNPKYNGNPDSGALPKGSVAKLSVHPQDTPLPITCDVHPWMSGYCWAFDHPYAVRTDKDGKFKMDVPAGAEVSVVVWHEGLKPGRFLVDQGFDGNKGKKYSFTGGKTETLNLKIKG